MKPNLVPAILLGGAAVFMAPLATRADEPHLSPEKLNVLNQRGYFTPAFKTAIHELISTKQAVEVAKAEDEKLKRELPVLKRQTSEAEAKVAALRQELSRYDNLEESDFIALQKQMTAAGASLKDQLQLAQAYIWAYPASPHQAQAQQFLQQIQKTLADQTQAEKDAEAARVAARAKLVQRAQARDLSLDEWKAFLRDMSQEDVLKYLGPPQFQGVDYWTFSGTWTTDPYTGQKVGLLVSFNGTRVNNVATAQP